MSANRPPDATIDAITKCVYWLNKSADYFGWKEKDLPALETLWWNYHDKEGKCITPSPAVLMHDAQDSLLFEGVAAVSGALGVIGSLSPEEGRSDRISFVYRRLENWIRSAAERQEALKRHE
jgi:hypothetical protein